jgi:hypothetical protein
MSRTFSSALILALVLPSSVIAQAPAPAPGAAEREVMDVVVRLFDGMRKGDSTMVRSTFDQRATMATAMIRRDGTPAYQRDESIEEFVQAVGTPHAETWDEKLWDPKVMVDRNLATVWTRYAFFLGTKFSHCGVDTFTLAKGAEGWKILFIADTRQQQGCDLPQNYSH